FCFIGVKNEFDEICLKSNENADKWFFDGGCSSHMTGDRSKFLALESKQGGSITFGDNNKGKIIGIGSIDS
ncbi:hypothetical protein, partial [Klebsiella pneumoniae]|uniref:hypothetical protein n=1 Tax=Klebsiella pneumoniae TaxID=573 RepID=UPI0039C4CB1A